MTVLVFIFRLAFWLSIGQFTEGFLIRSGALVGTPTCCRIRPRSFSSSDIHKSTENDENDSNASEFNVVKPLQVEFKRENSLKEAPQATKNARDTSKARETFIGTKSDQSFVEVLATYFVPGFVAIWAVGYGAVFFVETQGDGLGDAGGYLGAGLACILLISLMAAAVFEIMKPLDSSTS